MEYYLRGIRRKLSLVIVLIDLFTGLPARKVEVSLRGFPNNKPLVKQDGTQVFCDLPESIYEVCVHSEIYFPETVSVTGSAYVKMVPNRRYPAGTTWIEGRITPDTTIYVIPKGATGFKLLRCEDHKLSILSSSPYSLQNSYGLIDQELCWIGERVGEYTYYTDGCRQYPRNTALYPVSVGRSDAHGDLFCPVRRFLQEHTEVWLYMNGKLTIHPIAFGQGNIIETGG